MPEQDQILPPDGQTVPAQLDRWLAIQPLLDELFTEREAQIKQWGDQDLPLGFSAPRFKMMADRFRKECDTADKRGELTHRHILLEEFFEALAESNEAKARDELVQLGACVIKALQQIDRNADRRAKGTDDAGVSRG